MLYLYTPDQPELYLRLLRQALPDEPVAAWPTAIDAAAVTRIAAWKPPVGFFTPFVNVRTVFSLGAGVDTLLQRADLPADVDIIRIADAGMARQMIDYCLYGTLHYQRQMDHYAAQQRSRRWLPLDAPQADALRLSVLGLGALGSQVAAEMARLGYRVTGWSRGPHQIDGVRCLHDSAGLNELLADSDVLFCVLPATPSTCALLNAERLARLPDGAALINAGRGSLVDETALLAELDSGRLRFALLDVFAVEPLPDGHPFWQHPRVLITPHTAADTVATLAVRQIADNLRALTTGGEVTGRVDRRRGY